MKLQEIYNVLNEISPFELQEKWDNAGLLVGSFEDEINNIYISIDLDEELLSKVEKKFFNNNSSSFDFFRFKKSKF